jgi:hypothetical protein
MNSLEKAGHTVDSVDEDQVVERSRVGDDNPHSVSKAQSPQGRAFPLEVFQGVVEPHLMSLEKAVEFMASLQTEKLAQLRLSQPTSLVLFQRKCFQCAAGEIAPCGGEPLSDIVRDVECDFHS